VLAYLSRYTHRVAIANSRLITCDSAGVTFKYKDYRADGPARYKVMTLATGEFIRRFLIHVLPGGPPHPPADQRMYLNCLVFLKQAYFCPSNGPSIGDRCPPNNNLVMAAGSSLASVQVSASAAVALLGHERNEFDELS
jgi:hypothetical protein